MTGRLAGKVAVITGAASGIGRASAVLFASEGAKVVVVDVEASDGVIDEIASSGGTAYSVRMDVRSESDVERLFRGVISNWGKLDIVFNNAGVGLRKAVVDSSVDDFERVFDTNVLGTFLCCKYALPRMTDARSGVILNMSSNGGLIGRANDPLYCSAAHAIVGLTKSLAVGLAHLNIRVNALCPGPIDTPLLRSHSSGDDEFRAHLPSLLCSCPSARCGTAAEVAHAALFLVGDDCSFINGAAIAIDGAKSSGIMPNDRYRQDFKVNE